jgi:hypothetical protein
MMVARASVLVLFSHSHVVLCCGTSIGPLLPANRSKFLGGSEFSDVPSWYAVREHNCTLPYTGFTYTFWLPR